METVVLFFQMHIHQSVCELTTSFYTTRRLQHQRQMRRKKIAKARHRQHPTGRAIALVEVFQHMLGETDIEHLYQWRERMNCLKHISCYDMLVRFQFAEVQKLLDQVYEVVIDRGCFEV